MSEFPKTLLRMQFGSRDRYRLYERIIVQSMAGRQLRDIIEDLAGRVERRYGKRHYLYRVYQLIVGRIKSGARLADAVTGFVPEDEKGMLAAAEETGQIAPVLQILIDTGRMRMDIVRKARGGMTGPLISVAIAFGILWYFSAKILPGFEPFLKGKQLDFMARATVETGRFIRGPGAYLLPLAFAANVLFVVVSLPRLTGRVRLALDYLPLYGWYRQIQGSLWLAGFSTMSLAGVSERDAIKRMMRHATPYVRERLQVAWNGLRTGQSVWSSLMRHKMRFPDEETLENLEIMSGYPNYGENMARLSRENLRKTEESILQSVSVLNSFIEVVVVNGLIVVITLGITFIMNAMSSGLTGR